jgi:hypothetical protein
VQYMIDGSREYAWFIKMVDCFLQLINLECGPHYHLLWWGVTTIQ